MNTKLVIGLMSGTSCDGVDGALVRTDGESEFEFLDFVTRNYEKSFRQKLLDCARAETKDEAVVQNLEVALTDKHAKVVNELCDRFAGSKQTGEIGLIGFHGHTISHDPQRAHTRQIGDGQRLATTTGIPVVYDFRSADLRAGGQGAPLVPLFHRMLLSHALNFKAKGESVHSPFGYPTVIVNIGGVANMTWLEKDRVIAGDTGPGCALLDDWVRANSNQSFDADGKLAAQGTVDDAVVAKAQKSNYSALPFPKSADRFDFQSILVDHLSLPDGAATLCAVTAATIVDAIIGLGRQHAMPKSIWIAGGGSKHPLIMRGLQDRVNADINNDERNVRPIDELGLRADSLEAECFAWLAMRRIRGLPTTLPSTTGCRAPTCGGEFVPV